MSLMAASLATDREEPAAREIRDRYLGGTGIPCSDDVAALKFEIDASLPRMHKRGIMRGLKLVLGAGRVAFTQLHFAGDDLIRTAVIARFLAAEAKEQAACDDLSITERNYRFRYKGKSEYGGRVVFVFRVTPKSRRVGLFRGEVWLDEKTARPLREWGWFVKSPSAFISNIYFVRDYVLDGGTPHPRRIILKLRAAFVGPAELTMWLDEPHRGS